MSKTISNQTVQNSTEPSPRRICMLIGISIASFLGCIDFTVVNTAIPAIAQDMNASIPRVQWVVSLFLMALCAFMVTAGRLADLYGRRRVLYVGMMVFGVSSLGAGLTESIGVLNGWRFIQGAACAVLYTVTVTIVADAFPDHQRGRAVGTLLGVNGLGLALGPVLGGIVVSTLGWRWVFLLNIPLILLSFAFCLGNIRESRLSEGRPLLDITGAILLVSALASLLLGINQGAEWGWLSYKTLSIITLAIVLFTAFFHIESRVAAPLVKLSLFRIPAFSIACLASALLAFFYCAAFFLMPLYLEGTRHYSGLILGLLLLPTTAVMALISPLIGRWMDAAGARPPLIMGFIALALSAGLQATFTPSSALWIIIAAFTLMGIGWGAILSPAAVSALNAVSAEQGGSAMGVAWTLHNLGGAMGLAVSSLIYTTFSQGYQSAMLLLVAISVVGLLAVSWRGK
ncbi:MFS transporter [Yersinia kristensenii]|uniref:MFS transporter n=2 Tax=Yersinia kristensenii TaxID=28152 RepID=UPI0016439EBB|nr:MFS transporter [Yersinia kristensenii]MBW5811246.1 MFS transporter [Yersinia kristensenii]MBW5814724.1 MFS transporter [Yersinia kristensenii]MBW5828520.1 MFS transporter [Yersinia kristensenii]MBW5840260.1 MFS transporter [Yersinia kristensenii]